MDILIAIIAGFAVLSFAVVLLVTFHGHGQAQAVVGPDGYQEATITIKGCYKPDRIRVEKGVPLRLHFIREEDDSCSDRVVFAGVGMERRLPAFQKTIIEFTPQVSGSFLFTCQWGMYRGTLVVSEPRKKGVGRAIE